ncbi:MAG: hypothetical protein AAF810_08770 [Cyanobacteria bacterium P01_D01_bin.36]
MNDNIFTDDTALDISERSGFQTVDFTPPEKVEDFLSNGEADTSPSKMPVAKNPLVRLGIAAVVVVGVMGFGAIVMLLGRDNSSELAEGETEGAEAQSLTLSLNPDDNTQATESAEIDAMKADMALLQQQLALAQIERGEQPRPEQVRESVQTQPTTPPQPAPRPAAARPAPARAQPVSAVRTRTPAPTPTVRRVVNPAPVVRAATPITPAAPSSTATNDEPPNPQAQWIAASNAGIIGVMPATDVVEPKFTQAEVIAFAPEPEYQLKSAVQVDFKQPTFVESTAQASVPGLYDAPRADYIPMQSVPAKVTTPITWLNADEQFLIELQNDLLDASGSPAILAGNHVVVQPMQVNESSGYAELAIVGITNGDETIPLDYTKLSIKAADGGPLIAERYGDVGGQIASNDLEMFAIGALAGIGQELIKPNSQTITNSAFGSSVSTQNGDLNIVGGILAGGTSQLADRMADRNDQRLDDIRGREQIFFLPEGMDVEIYISQDFQL